MDSNSNSKDVISASLLKRIPNTRSKDTHRWFLFGLGEWTDSSSDEEVMELEGPTKKLKLSLSHARDRWQEELSRKYVPKNTVSSTKWAMANFTLWKKARNERFADDPEKQVPNDLLLSDDASLLNKWLKLYMAETRKQDGSKHPPKTLYQLLAGLLRDMRSQKPNCSNFLDPNVKLRSSGVGSDSKSAEAIMKEEEAQLWEQGVLGTDSPRALLRAAFFLNGKNFCLQGGEEHRCLNLSQIKRYSAPDRYVYTENSSKNRSGGMAQMRVANKVVPIYAPPEAGIRCHVNVLDTYFSKLPRRLWRKTIST